MLYVYLFVSSDIVPQKAGECVRSRARYILLGHFCFEHAPDRDCDRSSTKWLNFNLRWRPQHRWTRQPQRDETEWIADSMLARSPATHHFSPKAMTKHKFLSPLIHRSSSSPNFNPQFSPFPFLDPSGPECVSVSRFNSMTVVTWLTHTSDKSKQWSALTGWQEKWLGEWYPS